MLLSALGSTAINSAMATATYMAGVWTAGQLGSMKAAAGAAAGAAAKAKDSSLALVGTAGTAALGGAAALVGLSKVA